MSNSNKELGQLQNNTNSLSPEVIQTIEEYLPIVDDGIRKKYLTRLSEMEIAPPTYLPDLEEDIINNVRMFRITEMVYGKREPVTDKFTTVFNTLATYNASIFLIIDSDGRENRLYLGVRNNERDDSPTKRSTVTLGDTLRQTLIGHFPGIKIQNEDRRSIQTLSKKILNQNNVASVSVVGSNKDERKLSNEQFIQGLEKLALAMNGRKFTGILIANNSAPADVQLLRKSYQDMYTKLSPYQRIQISENNSETTSSAQSFTEMTGGQKLAAIGAAFTSVAGTLTGGLISHGAGAGLTTGAMFGGQLTGALGSLIHSFAPNETISKSHSFTTSSTTENKTVTDMMAFLDSQLKKLDEYDSYGMWNVAGYFVSDDMSSAEIAASNYRSLMNGDNSNREVSAINSWWNSNKNTNGSFHDLKNYLSRFAHPQFWYATNKLLIDASTSVSGKELGLHLGLPRATIPGLPVIEHAEFGKEVNSYHVIQTDDSSFSADRLTLGSIFDLGQKTQKSVFLDKKSLNMHTFITGSTGSGKSNAVYQLLTELKQKNIPFLVVEPAKGEYKDVFGHLSDVSVFSTNPKVSRLININPFMFPDSIHVLEHIDGLVEIFSVCWTMYDAMPAFLKKAITQAYEAVGWDLNTSSFEGNGDKEYPDFALLLEQLSNLIEVSQFSSEVKSNYKGALLTRVESLTVGLNKSIFTSQQTPYEELFDNNCILDISRVKSTETKALIMGLMVYLLNEHRVDRKRESNVGLRHVTVLEEAHNLLKNRGGGESELVGKSIEMLTNTIAEIRTYGEGFVIVDQSPSSVDIAAIKNTNTKIVLRTPEAGDRKAVGRAMGLTDDQVNEISKLPTGVAVVYQNNWLTPVLCMINKASIEEKPYEYNPNAPMMSTKEARTNVVNMLMRDWFQGKWINKTILSQSLNTLSLSRETGLELKKLIEVRYSYFKFIHWKKEEYPSLRHLLMEVLSITNSDLVKIPKDQTQALVDFVSSKINTKGKTESNINQICYFITLKKVSENDDRE